MDTWLTMTPSEIIKALSTEGPDLAARVREIPVDWNTDGIDLTGKVFYLAFRDKLPTVDELIDIAHARIINFALPRNKIESAKKELQSNPGAMDPWVRLATEARDLFIRTQEQTGRSGELGELLLFMLLEWALKAPIVACKMYLKTSQQMPVHGTDGIHLGAEDSKLIVYWGESKLHSSLSSALTDISESISDYINTPGKYQNEIRILQANVNFDALNIDQQTAIKSYFNPYSESSNERIDVYACLAGYDTKIYDQVSQSSKADVDKRLTNEIRS